MIKGGWWNYNNICRKYILRIIIIVLELFVAVVAIFNRNHKRTLLMSALSLKNDPYNAVNNKGDPLKQKYEMLIWTLTKKYYLKNGSGGVITASSSSLWKI